MWSRSQALRVVAASAVLSTLVLLGGAALLRQNLRREVLDQEFVRFRERGAELAGLSAGLAEQQLEYQGRRQTVLRAADGSVLFEPGIGVTDAELRPHIAGVAAAVNTQGERELRQLRRQIQEVSGRVLEVLSSGGPQSATDTALAEIDEILQVLYQRARHILRALSAEYAGTLPDLSGENAVPRLAATESVLFYHPVATFGQNTDELFAGMLRLRLPTAELSAAVAARQSRLDEHLRRSLLWLLGALWLVHGLLLLFMVYMHRTG